MALTEYESAVVIWSIRGALLCMFVFLWLRISYRPTLLKSGMSLEYARYCWFTGSLLSTIHAVASMAYHHQFKHQLAFEDTAYQTQQVIGIAVGIGIYFNYAFVIIWLFDALWLIRFTQSYTLRNRRFDWLVYGYLAFIAFNGAIVFETGLTRWFALLAFTFLAITYVRNTRSEKANGTRK